MSFGLLQRDLDEISVVLKRFPQIKKAVLFGSRAKGNFKPGSDVDIAVMGSDIDYSCVSELSSILNEESLLPYFFDIVHFEGITEQRLVEHILRVGKTIYLAQQSSGPATGGGS